MKIQMVSDFKITVFKTSENYDYGKTVQLTSKVGILTIFPLDTVVQSKPCNR